MTEPTPLVVALAPRQLAVLTELVKDGASNIQIARRLYVSEDTVKTHLRTIMARCGVGSRTELVVAVLTGRVIITHA